MGIWRNILLEKWIICLLLRILIRWILILTFLIAKLIRVLLLHILLSLVDSDLVLFATWECVFQKLHHCLLIYIFLINYIIEKFIVCFFSLLLYHLCIVNFINLFINFFKIKIIHWWIWTTTIWKIIFRIINFLYFNNIIGFC
jgi:hypothetical protein